MSWFDRRRPPEGVPIAPTYSNRHLWQCNRPPYGWTCPKTAGHDGPCPASPPPGVEFAVALESTGSGMSAAEVDLFISKGRSEVRGMRERPHAQGLEWRDGYIAGAEIALSLLDHHFKKHHGDER